MINHAVYFDLKAASVNKKKTHTSLGTIDIAAFRNE